MLALQAVLIGICTLLASGGTAEQDTGTTATTAAVEVTDIAPAPDQAPAPLPPFIPLQPEPPMESLRWGPGVPQLAEPFFVILTHPVDGSEIVEGEEVRITWKTGGPVSQVRIYYQYENCRLGGAYRGSVGRLVGGGTLPNTGQYSWIVPWMDTHQLRLRIAGYEPGGGLIGAEEVGLQFRPKELKDLPPTAIGIIKSRQRLYYFEDGKIKRMHIISTAMSGYWTPYMEPGSYDPRRGRMGQVFYKDTNAWSKQYNCWMPYWMAITSSGSHGIHATSPPFYHRLGSPASHGCVRQHQADARKLFHMVRVGTPVYIR